MINKLILDKNAMALIICPTRELASQVMQTVLKLKCQRNRYWKCFAYWW